MITNKGLRISAETTEPNILKVTSRDRFRILPLGCCWAGDTPGLEIGILLHDDGDGVWHRALATHLGVVRPKDPRTMETLLIRKHGDLSREHLLMRSGFPNEIGFDFASPEAEFVRAVPADRWSAQGRRFLTTGLDRFTGFVEARERRRPEAPWTPFVIVCGFDFATPLWYCPAVKTSKNGIYEAAMAEQLEELRTKSVNHLWFTKPKLPGRLRAKVECSVAEGKFVSTYVVQTQTYTLSSLPGKAILTRKQLVGRVSQARLMWAKRSGRRLSSLGTRRI